MWWMLYRKLWEDRFDRLADYLKKLQADAAAKESGNGQPK
jgi:hypothetical protein